MIRQLLDMLLNPCSYRYVMVARAGVQPATFALGVRCSMQLSYRATSRSVSEPLPNVANDKIT